MKLQRLSGLGADLLGHHLGEQRARFGVTPLPLWVLTAGGAREVKASGPAGQPQFLQGRLCVDDQRAAVGQFQLQQAAIALAVDVDGVVVQPAVQMGFDG